MAKENTQARPQRGPGHGPGQGRIVQKPKSMKKAFKMLFTYLKPYKVVFIIVILFASLSAVFNIFGPKLLGEITNEVQIGIFENTAINFDRIYQIMWILIMLYALSYIFNVLQGVIITRLTQKLTKKMRTDLFEKIDRVPLKYFDQTSHGDTLSRMTNDIDLIGQALNSSVTQIFTSITLLIGILVMMLIVSWQLALVALISLPLSGLIMRFIMKKSQKYFRRQQKTLGSLNGHIEEAYSGQQILKAYQAEAKFLTIFEQYNEDLYETSWKSQFFSGLMFPIMNFVGNLSYMLVAVFGGILAVSRTIMIGDIQSMLQYIRNFNQPLGSIAQNLTQFQSALAATERVFEFLNQEEMIKEEKTQILNDVKGHVTFKDVRFGYEPDKEIIHGFNLEVKPGQKVAIVGPTGAGKTTLVNLLMRFYEVNSGDIMIDDVSIKHMSRHEVHKLFSMVLQDTWLFHGSIKDNLKYGHKDASDDDVINAAKTANVHHFIKSLSFGYDHILTENSSISQGQQQLLTIARAMVANAPMLILDEATSSVDVRTEMLIQEAMDRLMKGRTTFVIAHRLSTIKNADIILVLNEGNIIETGSHEELLAKQGFYADLYNSQFDQ
ncbi:MAG: ABC transporter ATP-binding protein [Acholeplasmataceae bacterium]